MSTTPSAAPTADARIIALVSLVIGPSRYAQQGGRHIAPSPCADTQAEPQTFLKVMGLWWVRMPPAALASSVDHGKTAECT
jgi:hypothetical protein